MVDPTTPYTSLDNGQLHWALSGAVGLMLRGGNGTSGGLEALTSAGGGRYQGVGLRGNVKVAF